ncbi:MAG TPA: hypothetical protein VHN14_35795 [Kofleriaceae bacterium]|jgi:hypothetical protein|nr:hypothetical protein [Kofleriaceae bacterium]
MAGTKEPEEQTKRQVRDTEKPPGARPSAHRLEIELEVSRNRSIGWTIFGLIFGGLLLWKLGTVGVWVGLVLVAMGAYHAWNLTQTFRYPPGTIVVSDREVSLPRGLCVPRPVLAKPSEITAVYFLRRSVPWNHAAPVLIIELGPKAMAFPRDWFASEADQRRIVHALLRDKADAGAAKPTDDDDDRSA